MTKTFEEVKNELDGLVLSNRDADYGEEGPEGGFTVPALVHSTTVSFMEEVSQKGCDMRPI